MQIHTWWSSPHEPNRPIKVIFTWMLFIVTLNFIWINILPYIKYNMYSILTYREHNVFIRQTDNCENTLACGSVVYCLAMICKQHVIFISKEFQCTRLSLMKEIYSEKDWVAILAYNLCNLRYPFWSGCKYWTDLAPNAHSKGFFWHLFTDIFDAGGFEAKTKEGCR